MGVGCRFKVFATHMHPHPLRNGSIRRTLLYLRGFHAIGNIRLPSIANFVLTHKQLIPKLETDFFYILLKVKLSYLSKKKKKKTVVINLYYLFQCFNLFVKLFKIKIMISHFFNHCQTLLSYLIDSDSRFSL